VTAPAFVGAVLCGGRSTRMGRDKAFVEIDGVAMARRVADALVAAGCFPVVAIGGDVDGLAALGLRVVADRWPGEGPVGGVRTALGAFPDAAGVVVVACDTPWLDGVAVASLVRAVCDDPAVMVAVAHTDRVEPLCAAWRPAALPVVAEAMNAGERRLHAVVAALPAATVALEPSVLRNVNAPTDVPG
jgi:molybdopterin-guanine dinucleotide biosynthesis protein A